MGNGKIFVLVLILLAFLKPTASFGLECPQAMLLKSLNSPTSIKIQNYRERFFKPSQIIFTPHSEKATVITKRKTIEYNNYLENLSFIQNRMSSAFGDLSQIKSVAMPYSGDDAATPVKLFPQATDVYAFDKHGFMSTEVFRSYQNIHFTEPEMEIGGYMNVQTLDENRFLAPQILGALKKSVPNFRLLRLRVFSYGTSETSGVIYYDQGRGTLTRRYFQIHDELGTEQSWFSVFSKFKPQAVIVKASMYNQARKIEDAVVKTLEESNGILVEGTSFGLGELSSFSGMGQSPTRLFGTNAALYGNTLGVSNVIFGYEGRAFIKYYKDPL